MSGLYFSVGADFDKLQKLKREIDGLKAKLQGMDRAANPKEFTRLEKQLRQMSREFDREAAAAQKAAVMTQGAGEAAFYAANDFSRLQGILTKIGGIAVFSRFIKEVVDVRSEFQNTEASFKVFLGSAEKAASFMKDIQSYAFHNVFEFKDLTKQAAQLLAFQHRFEDIIPIIDKLSNIAAGANIPLEQLVDLYNKAKSQGKLLTQDIQQWQRAGVPVIQELAKAFSKTEAEMWKMVTTGTVGFKEIDSVINTLTSDGGMFAGMMEEKMKTLGDSIGLLQDSITAMFNEIGQSSQEFLRGGILLTNTLVENYQTIGKIILGIIATYGTYRAALVTTTALEKANMLILRQAVREKNLAATAGIRLSSSEAAQIATKKLLTFQTLKYTTALKAQTAAMLVNPAVLLTAAIAGLGFAMYNVVTTTTAFSEAQERLKKAQSDVTESTVSEMRKLDQYDRKLREVKKDTKEYKDLKDEIVKQYGKYFSGLDTEINKVGNLTTAYKTLSVAITQSIAERKFEAFQEQEQKHLDKVIGDNLDKAYDKIIEKYGKEKGSELYKSFYEYAIRGISMDSQTWKKLNEVTFSEWGFKNSPIGFSIRSVAQLATEISNEKSIVDQALEKFKNEYLLTIDEINNGNSTLSNTFVTFSEQVTNARDKVALLKKELQELRKGVKPEKIGEGEQFDFAKGIEDKTKELKDAENNLSLLLYGKSSLDFNKGESAAEKAKKQAQELADLQVKMYNDREKRDMQDYNAQLESREKRLELLEDSFQKEQKLLDLNLDKEILAIHKRVQERVEKEQEFEKQEWEKAGKKGVFVPKTLTSSGLFAKHPELEQEFNESLLLAKEAFDKGMEKINKSLLEKYKDFDAQRKAINKQYKEDLDALMMLPATDENKAAIEQLKKNWKEALSAIDLEELKDTLNWEVVFGDLDKVSTQTIDRLRSKIKEYLQEFGKNLSPKDMQVLVQALENLDRKQAEQKPFQALKDSWAGLKQVYGEYKKISKDTQATEEAKEEALNNVKAAVVSLNEAFGFYVKRGREMLDMASALTGLMDELEIKTPEQVTRSIEGLDKIVSSLESIDLTRPVSVVTGAIGALSGVAKVFKGIFGGKDEISQAVFDRYESLMSILDTIIARQKELLSSSAGAKAVKEARETIEIIEKQIEATKKLGNNFLDSGSGAGSHSYGRRQYERLKKYRDQINELGLDFDSWGDRIHGIYDLTADELILLQRQLPEAWNELNEETKGFLQAIIDSGDELRQVKNQLNEILTGISFDSVTNSLKSMLADTDTTMEKVAENFENYMRDAIANIIINSVLADEIQQWYQNFADAMEDETLTEKELAALKQEYQDIFADARRQYEAAIQAAGIDSGISSQQASRGVYQGMSQDTGDRLEARNTGIHMTLISAEGHLLGISQQVGGIHDQLISLGESARYCIQGMQEIRAIQLNSYYELKDINNNTKELYQMNTRLGEMNQKLDRL